MHDEAAQGPGGTCRISGAGEHAYYVVGLMSQSEILSILDHPMTAKEIAKAANLPLQCAKGNLTRMRYNHSIFVAGHLGKQLLYAKEGTGQDEVLAAIGHIPTTQKELSKALPIQSGVLSHRLNSLLKKGLIVREVLEVRYRPFGYRRADESI